ncbi:MAG: hypothetical protein BWZ02_01707 [Lentisphaerae bacterium ADurb.BinA184]|nr:MAG: hypothetical protein BWZ02_01707 [Lentisphaerae bacterium ADurb.BinA184]
MRTTPQSGPGTWLNASCGVLSDRLRQAQPPSESPSGNPHRFQYLDKDPYLGRQWGEYRGRNQLFMDGHVEWFSTGTYRATDMERQSDNDLVYVIEPKSM